MIPREHLEMLGERFYEYIEECDRWPSITFAVARTGGGMDAYRMERVLRHIRWRAEDWQ